MKTNITIAFLGIDGTGKSTHAEKINSWLQEKGIKCIIIPFHKWMFAGIFKKIFGNYVDKGRVNTSLKPYIPKRYSMAGLIKPPVAFIDNILMFYFYKWKYKNYDVIIFDRFICATMIKSKALNYHVDWLRPLWRNFRTDIGIVLDAPLEKSIETIHERGDHIIYTAAQLQNERNEYFEIAKKSNYPIFETSNPFEIVNEEIKNYLKESLLIPFLRR